MKQNDPFSVWKKYNHSKKQNNEIYRKEMFQKVHNAIHLLSNTYDWEQLYIFGSLIQKGAFTKYSDIDIGISGLNNLDYYSFIADISGILEKDVDVILLEESDFTDQIIKRGIQWKK